MTAHDPLSTFAADVDTASYDIFRRDVNLGLLPQPASVRLEEHVNNFDYEYPAPTASDAHPFRISLAAAGDMFHRETTLLRVGIAAREPVPFEKRPANVVFLVDVSGSMAAADKLPLVKRVLARTLDVLSPEDTISIVTYSATAVVRLAPTAARDKARILPIIDSLVASGSTAGAAALDARLRPGAARVHQRRDQPHPDVHRRRLQRGAVQHRGAAGAGQAAAADRHHPDRARLRDRQPERRDDGEGEQRRQRHLRRHQQRHPRRSLRRRAVALHPGARRAEHEDPGGVQSGPGGLVSPARLRGSRRGRQGFSQ